MIIVNSAFALICSYRLLMAYQQSGYISLGIKGFNRKYLYFAIVSLIISVSSTVLDLTNVYDAFYVAGAVATVTQAVYIYLVFREKYKKPLVFTMRVIRLLSVIAVIIILCQLLYFTELRSLVFSVYILLPFIIKLADSFMSPFEKLNNLRYINRAKRWLNDSNAVKIGITGSFGKTSVKTLLAEILSRRFKVVATPSSFNTPLGIARACSKLRVTTEVFIAEMGARHRGDIKELTEIVKPSIGIVTGVNNQHQETFKKIENTQDTKYELIEGLTGERFAVVNADNPYSLEMASRGIPCYTVGESEGADLRIINVKTGTQGTTFDLLYNNEIINLSTKLIGRHNALNIALCVAVALHMGLRTIDIISAVNDLAPVPHRLELIRGARGITIIDDTYNSNPDGAEAALKVLDEFSGRKVVATPGLVELGNKSMEENIRLGERLKGVCDLVILIKSPYTNYILKGLQGYNDDCILQYNSLKEATIDFSKVLRDKDILLLLNDLTDSMGG